MNTKPKKDNATGLRGDVNYRFTKISTRRSDFMRMLSTSMEYTFPKTVLSKTIVDVSRLNVERVEIWIVSDPENASHEWVLVVDKVAAKHSNNGYGDALIALSDAMLVVGMYFKTRFV